MREPTFDKDGYPTEETLLAIREWDANDLGGLFQFVAEAWNLDYGRALIRCVESSAEGRHWIELHTGGWSGNEDIIGALQANTMAWTLAWWSSRRGGHYEFRWTP